MLVIKVRVNMVLYGLQEDDVHFIMMNKLLIFYIMQDSLVLVAYLIEVCRRNNILCCVTGYVIERRLVSEKRWEKVDSVDASVTLYCVENLREKSEYEFRVYAENPVGRSLEPAMTEQVRLKTHASKFGRIQ